MPAVSLKNFNKFFRFDNVSQCLQTFDNYSVFFTLMCIMIVTRKGYLIHKANLTDFTSMVLDKTESSFRYSYFLNLDIYVEC